MSLSEWCACLGRTLSQDICAEEGHKSAMKWSLWLIKVSGRGRAVRLSLEITMPSLIAFLGPGAPRRRGGRSSPVFEDFIGLASMAPVWRREGHAIGRRNTTDPSESVATRNAKLIDGSVRRMGCEFVECLTGYSLETEFLTETEFHRNRNRFSTHCFSYVYV